MNPETDIFGTTFDCECGRRHSIQPGEIIFAHNAAERLPEVAASHADGRRVCLLMDERTRPAAGHTAAAHFEKAGWQVQQITVPDPGAGMSPVCDDNTRSALESKVKDCNIMIAAGSGVISDLVKWIAFDRDLPYIALATAASMNGYASANVAPSIKGVKTLLRARPPVAVAADPQVLQQAPARLTAAGLGDILAKSVSSTDWKMNQILFNDFYCERSVNLIARIEPLYRDNPEDVRDARPEAISALFTGLLLTGVAMTMAETSSPSSGGEHMVSHTLDMMSSVDGHEHDLHGRQVGVGTIIASEIYARVLALESPDFREPRTAIDRKFWGSLAPVVAEHYRKKLERLQKAGEILSRKNAWDDLRSQLQPMLRTPQEIKNCLRRAGAAHTAEHIGCDRKRLLAALLHAHEIRSRFTILDLAGLVSILPECGREIVETWT